MSVVLRRLALEPFLTGPLLLALRSNSPRLAALLSSITPRQKEIAITTLKWLLTLGVVSRINRLMTAWALNNWKVDSGSRAWIWDREIAVVTGGSSGKLDVGGKRHEHADSHTTRPQVSALKRSRIWPLPT